MEEGTEPVWVNRCVGGVAQLGIAGTGCPSRFAGKHHGVPGDVPAVSILSSRP